MVLQVVWSQLPKPSRPIVVDALAHQQLIATFSPSDMAQKSPKLPPETLAIGRCLALPTGVVEGLRGQSSAAIECRDAWVPGLRYGQP